MQDVLSLVLEKCIFSRLYERQSLLFVSWFIVVFKKNCRSFFLQMDFILHISVDKTCEPKCSHGAALLSTGRTISSKDKSFRVFLNGQDIREAPKMFFS